MLFHYDDFGPQAMAGELLGQSWWSWEAGGSFEPCDAFDVRVAVHAKQAAQWVTARYPTVRGESDVRIVARADALLFLDAKIAELLAMPKGPDEYDFGPLRRDLERTRATILACLPE